MAQIDNILMHAADVNASDLHIGEDIEPVVRVYGELRMLSEMTDPVRGKTDFWKAAEPSSELQGVRFSVAEAQSLFPDKESRVMRFK